MQKFHLTLYPTRWLLRKTSCLKIRGRLVKGNIICRKRSWTVAKQRKTAAVRNSAEQWANQENNCRDTPLSGKEKATPKTDAACNERSEDFVRAVPLPAYAIRWENSSAKSALKYPPLRWWFCEWFSGKAKSSVLPLPQPRNQCRWLSPCAKLRENGLKSL